MPPDDTWIELGRVIGAFGIRGWIRIESYTEPPEGILAYPQWHLRSRDGRRLVRVEEARPQGRQIVARLAGCNDRDMATRMARETIEVPRGELPALKAREHYRADLIGMKVRRTAGELIGTVSHFVDTPGHAIMIVKGEREHWVPAVAEHLRRVDRAGGTVWVDWQEPEGLPEE